MPPRAHTPWSRIDTQHPPLFQVVSRSTDIDEIYYAGESFQGKPTRVHAYLARPATEVKGPQPGMVLVHGGGGKAFREWAEHWSKRGYHAIAIDLAGNGPAGRLPGGGPDQSDATKFRDFGPGDIPDMWSYHAVANILHAHTLLAHQPGVDPSRIGLTGISWGGYLTCLTAPLDSRFKVAIPVYGCGFLGDNSVWKEGSLAAMKPEARALWLRTFDPSQYLNRVSCPMLFLNGTTDFAYPLDSYQKTYRLVPDRLRSLSIVTNLPHGHIWTFPEVDAFADQALRQGIPLAKVGAPRVVKDALQAAVIRAEGNLNISVCWTADSGPWQKRRWMASPGRVENGVATGALPSARPLVAYLALTDARGLRVSTDFIELP